MARRRPISLSKLRPHRGKIGLGTAAVLLIAAIALTVLERENRGPPLTGRADIVDGDTIKIAGTRIRLYGIDAPEKNQTCYDDRGVAYACGRRAAEALGKRIEGLDLVCEPKDTDRYGRIVARCSQGNTDINAWMVAHGWALAYRQFSTDYVTVEEKAHTRHVGIWSGTFENPASWRQHKKK